MRTSPSQQQGFTPTPNFRRSYFPWFGSLLRCCLGAGKVPDGRREQSSQPKNCCRGFTLVEMLVSIALFSVVITMSVGTLLVLVEANGRTQGMQLVMTNLTFSLDSLTREVRTGLDWYCDGSVNGSNIPAGATQSDCVAKGNISVVESGSRTTGGVSADERRITYWFEPNHYGSGHGAILRNLGQGNNGIPLTGEDIDVDEFVVTVTGSARLNGAGDASQPKATMYVKGKAGVIAAGLNKEPAEFAIQTTVSQRLIDY